MKYFILSFDIEKAEKFLIQNIVPLHSEIFIPNFAKIIKIDNFLLINNPSDRDEWESPYLSIHFKLLNREIELEKGLAFHKEKSFVLKLYLNKSVKYNPNDEKFIYRLRNDPTKSYIEQIGCSLFKKSERSDFIYNPDESPDLNENANLFYQKLFNEISEFINLGLIEEYEFREKNFYSSSYSGSDAATEFQSNLNFDDIEPLNNEDAFDSPEQYRDFLASQ